MQSIRVGYKPFRVTITTTDVKCNKPGTDPKFAQINKKDMIVEKERTKKRTS